MLELHYRNRLAGAAAVEYARAGGRVVGLVGTGIPTELVAAAGFFPLGLSGEVLDDTPLADEFMEDDLGRDTLSVFERMLDGTYAFLDLLIVSRTSDNWLQLYYYLKEVVRLGRGQHVPPLYLYDLLHLRSDTTYRYGLARTLELRRRLEVMVGGPITDPALEHAIGSSNARRALQRELDAARRAGLVTGTEAFQLIGASLYLPPAEYTRMLTESLTEIRSRPTLAAGPRLFLVTGTPLFTADLHQAIEAAGATVIGEDDCYGARSVGVDISSGTADPLRAIFDKSYFDAPSPRIYPSAARHAWLLGELDRPGLDGVVFYIPPGDQAFGWDYPHLAELVAARGLPSLRLQGADALSAVGRANISESMRGFVTTRAQPTHAEARR